MVSAPIKRVLNVPPRNYVIAFEQKGFGRTYSDFRKKLSANLENPDTFIHGVCILKNDWFAGRLAYKPATELYGWDRHGLLRFYSALLKGQQNYSIYPVDLDAYLDQIPGAEAPPPDSPPLPEQAGPSNAGA
ncbi:hypothetical protein IVA98_26040 [Bradyrhizobium sp. 160]|uniref:hypothetical protein n=1 Tax=Bradyrhizobium sp. 160 TaxID=2782634 RepID=UPI001FF82F23|nr:hypothetical protein [Bradyrhizobium sp. 160]MCK1626558.1 hypothetical protein [Bradyrhizobium sp. 160]